MRAIVVVVCLVLWCKGGVFAWSLTSNSVGVALVDALTTFLPPIFHVERCLTYNREDNSKREEFDFIVVGGGAGGSPLALRLTENENWNVLLLEAGGEEVHIMDVPFFISQFLKKTDSNWHYTTTPQSTCCLVTDNRQCDYPAGRVMGGSTAINFMFDIRGNAKDFDNWAHMGNEGWSFSDLLPYFKKVEDMQIPELQDSDLRGVGGKIKITYPEYFSDVGKLILRGGGEAGFPLTDDYNGASQTGIGRIQTTTFKGERWSANRGYLNEARQRKNLFVRTDSYVTSVIIEGGRATGVRYIRGGKEMQAYATKEVILSAGAVNSPAILMRSGIGPADHLRKIGIPLVQDLPVGYNLMDHTAFFGTFVTFNQTVSPDASGILLNPLTYLNYYVKRSGPFTVPGPFEVVSFHDLEGTPLHSPGWPQIEILYSSFSAVYSEKAASVFQISKDAFEKYLKPIQNKPSMAGIIWRVRPKSRGRIYLQDKNPISTPQIDLNAFSEPEDVDAVLAGFREYQKLISTPSFQAVGAKLVDTPIPGCENFTFDTDDYWRCGIQSMSISIYHQSGTCKMGPNGDETAVVTPDLKVKGVDGLMVADASIAPLVITGHLQFVTYAIGEKVADLMKDKYR